MDISKMKEFAGMMETVNRKHRVLAVMGIIETLSNTDEEKTIEKDLALDMVGMISNLAYNIPAYIRVIHSVVDELGLGHLAPQLYDDNLFVDIPDIVKAVKSENINVKEKIKKYMSQAASDTLAGMHIFKADDQLKARLLKLHDDAVNDVTKLKDEPRVIKAVLIDIACIQAFDEKGFINEGYKKELKYMWNYHPEYTKKAISKFSGIPEDSDKFDEMVDRVMNGRFRVNLEPFVDLIERGVFLDPNSHVQVAEIDVKKIMDCDGDCEHCEHRDEHGHGSQPKPQEKLYGVNRHKTEKKTMKVIEGESAYPALKRFEEFNSFITRHKKIGASKYNVIKYIKKRLDEINDSTHPITDKLLEDLSFVQQTDHKLAFRRASHEKFEETLKGYAYTYGLTNERVLDIQAKGYILIDVSNL